MKHPKRWRFVVTVRPTKHYNMRDVQDYIADAVQSWGGQLHPDDEMFDHFRDATVTRLRGTTKKESRK